MGTTLSDKQTFDIHIQFTDFAACDLLSILFMWQKHTTCLPTDKRVLEKMTELANSGVRRIPEMQLHIKHYVEQVLFAGTSAPPLCDSRFWPNGKAVMKCIYRATTRAKFVISICPLNLVLLCNCMYAIHRLAVAFLSMYPSVCASVRQVCAW